MIWRSGAPCRIETWMAVGLLLAAGCSVDSTAPPEIQHQVLGTWAGTTAGGAWVEMQVLAEDSGCCSRVASGVGRVAAPAGDTLQVEIFGFNQTGHVFFNFGGGPEPLLGQFSGHFQDNTNLAGVMLGPSYFGNPPAGPFTEDSVSIVLHRQ